MYDDIDIQDKLTIKLTIKHLFIDEKQNEVGALLKTQPDRIPLFRR